MQNTVETAAGSAIARSAATAVGAPLDVLISALGHVTGMRQVLSTPGEFEDGEKIPPAIDGGVRMAFDNTLVRILSRIDSLVDDSRNWRPARREARQATAAHVAVKLQRARQGAEQTRPSVRYSDKLELSVAAGGECVVLLRLPGGVVYGAGETFGAAMDNFDARFLAEKPVVATAPEGTGA